MKRHLLAALITLPIIIVAAGLTSSIALGSPARNVDKIKAIVNDEVITQNELDQKIMLIKKQFSQTQQPIPSDAELSKNILDNLIYTSLQLQLAKKAGMKIADSELDEAIANIAKKHKLTPEQMRHEMQKQHMDFATFREQIRNEMLFSRLQEQFVERDLDLTDEEIAAYMQAHPTIDTPEPSAKSIFMIHDLLISFPNQISAEKIAALKTQVAAKIKETNAELKTIAANFSKNYKVKVNDLGWRRLEDLPDLFAQELKKLRTAETDLVGPLEAPNGIHILKIIDARSAAATNVRKSPITKAQAQNLLWREKMNNKVKAWLDELRSKAYIDIKQD